MKKFIAILSFFLFVQTLYAQTDSLFSITNVIDSLCNDTTKAQSSSALPSLLQQQNVQHSKPTITSIISEIPNDTIPQTVKIKVVTTEELVAKEKMFTELASAPLEEKKTANDTKKFESFADPEDTIAIPGRTYKIQVYALQKELTAQIKDIQKKVGQNVPVVVDQDDGLQKYMVGSFNTYYDAITYRDELVKKGFKGAFVVVYFKGQRVSRQEKGFVKKTIANKN